MSYILDALKKSEQDRELGKTPTIHSVPAASAVRQSSSLLIWLLGGALFLLSTAGAYIYFSRASLPEQQPQVAKVTPKLEPVPSPAIPDPIVVAEPSATAQSNVVNIATEVARQEVRLPKSDRVEDVRAPKLSTPKKDNPPPVSRETEPREVSERPQDAITPLLEELPAAERAGMPQAPSVDVHVYSSVPSERFVLLDMKRYAEGQQTSAGFVVEEILVDGVVLKYQRIFFRLGTK